MFNMLEKLLLMQFQSFTGNVMQDVKNHKKYLFHNHSYFLNCLKKSLDPDQKEELVTVLDKLLSDRTTLVVGSAVMAFDEV